MGHRRLKTAHHSNHQDTTIEVWMHGKMVAVVYLHPEGNRLKAVEDSTCPRVFQSKGRCVAEKRSSACLEGRIGQVEFDPITMARGLDRR